MYLKKKKKSAILSYFSQFSPQAADMAHQSSTPSSGTMAAAHSYSHPYQSRKNRLFFPYVILRTLTTSSLSKFYHFHISCPSTYTGVRLDNIYNWYQRSSCESSLWCVSGTHDYWDGKVNGKHIDLVYWRCEWTVERLKCSFRQLV